MFNCKYDLTGSVFKFKVVLKATSWTLTLYFQEDKLRRIWQTIFYHCFK